MRVIFVIFAIFGLLSAKSQLPSLIPPADEFWIDLDTKSCDELCLIELVKNREFASFMAKYNPDISQNKELLRNYNAIKWGLNLNEKTKIAVLLPKTLKSYAKAIKTAIQAYILSHEAALSAHFIQSKSENDIQIALKKARQIGARVFIAPVKEIGLQEIAKELESNEIAYIPTLNKNDIDTKGRIIFGGIDYGEQILMLASLVQSKAAIFSDDSQLAKNLDELIRNTDIKVLSHIRINNDETSINALQDRAKVLNDANIFLNLPLIKSAFAINYLAKFEIKPKMLLSTQIGFNPQIFSLISPLARGEMIVASSINKPGNDLSSAADILGAGGWYNWVSYSCALGFEKLGSRYVDVINRLDFKEKIASDRVLYETNLYKLGKVDFIPLNP